MAATDPRLPRARWRLVSMRAHDGATNMAIDEAIMSAVAAGESPPTVRFYGWQPPCVSIGYAQPMRETVDLDACRERGYTWVRRPTGGRAVLHIDELTYSVTAPQDEPRVVGDIVSSYRRLSRGLVAGLRRLGCDVVQADRQDAEAGGVSAACFDVPSHYEVTAQGRKLIGSAQVRRRGVVLQHGALPLRGDVARLADVLTLEVQQRVALREHLLRRAIALDAALGREVTWDEVTRALAAGMSEALAIDLLPGDLTVHELAAATRLQAHYASDEWTFAR
ncbi:MAG: lipoate--protein ligase family protein [Anaerolineae bacterium]|nr:lipoate--protein ligase family protein [Anaerolineae bacterium]